MDQTRGHILEVKDRKFIKITGVKHVESYDDREIILKTSMGDLIIRGTDLNINSLNLEDGSLQVIGLVENFLYAEEAGARRKNFIKRILK
ncbi:MAG: sporulation protein YabP [Clostridia bacterium]|jgi:sporulation protein YabP|nr:sporulation protein YabP [Clostridia bacterium]